MQAGKTRTAVAPHMRKRRIGHRHPEQHPAATQTARPAQLSLPFSIFEEGRHFVCRDGHEGHPRCDHEDPPTRTPLELASRGQQKGLELTAEIKDWFVACVVRCLRGHNHILVPRLGPEGPSCFWARSPDTTPGDR